MNNLTIKTNSTKLIRIGIACCIAFFLLCMNGFSQKAPHIVVNIADDHTIYDCSTYGSKEVSTPNIDILAKQGKKFTQAFVSSPTCTPSRSSFLTGLFPFRNGCHPNHGEVKPGTTNLRKLLYDKYYVFVIGKPGIGPGGQNLIDLGKVLSNGKVNTSVLNSASNKNKIIYKSANNKENFTSTVNSIFSAFKNQPKSICIFLAYKDPHVPWNKGSKNALKIIVPDNHINTNSYRNARNAYLKEVHYVDEMVGAVNAKVKQHVDYDNVVSIYTSDHGAQLPFAKWNMYDDGNRVPFIVRWPDGGVKAGTITDAIISLVDLPSTFMEIGGIPANKNLDSKSFLNVLQEKIENSEECRTETYLTHTSGGISYAMRAIRTDQYKYIVNLNPRYNKNPTWYYNKKIAVDADFPYYKDWLKQTDAHSKSIIKHHERRGVQEELYDVTVDPLELNNLAENKAYDSVRLTLYYKLTKWRLQQGEQTYSGISNMLPNLIAPINLVASNITKTSFKLTWSPSIGKKNPNGYKVYVSLNGSNIKTINASGTSVSVTGLTQGKKYVVRVSGTSSSGETSKSYPISVLVQGQGKTYEINASAGANGSITPLGKVTVNQGANQTFTIKANTGYKVKDVLVDNISVGDVTTYTFQNIKANHTIRATFAPVPTHSISATSGLNGSISPSGNITVSQGASQTFDITANPGYKIQDVRVDNISVGAVSSYTFTNVQNAHTIHATFETSPVPDPVALYNFDGDARDAIGNNHGTINGGAGFAPGKEAQALSLDGTNDYVSISRSIQSNFSIAFWMKTSQTGPTGSYWYQGNGLVDAEMGGKKEDFGTALLGNTVSFGVGPTDVTVKASTAVNDNKWHHVAVTRNANTGEMIIYIDGVAEGSKIGAKGAKNTPSTIHFGNIHTNKRYYKGLLDMVGLYNIVLTPAEVAELANKTTIAHTIVASAGPNGTITPSGAIPVNDGANQSFVITSDNCSSIGSILVDNVAVAPTSTYTFENVKTDHTITATFNQGKQYTISTN
ncbi:MAG: sulfatase-like hydrolase/transferase, partial [Bacteroidales bacterium]|nr:sulfatase-like hydrolase/transferase [Bacteroidales bacterium]